MRKLIAYAVIFLAPLALFVAVDRPMASQMPMKAVVTPEGTYVNLEHLFLFRPPPGWAHTETFPPQLAATAVVAFERRAGPTGPVSPVAAMMGASGDAKANVMVRVWPWDTTVDTVIELLKRPNPLRDYSFRSEGPIDVGHIQGYHLHYAFGPIGDYPAGEHEERYVAAKGKIYLISYMPFGDARFEDSYEVAKAAMESFRFLEPVTIDIENGVAIVDGKRYDRLPLRLHLTVGDPHTIVAEPRQPFWPWERRDYTFVGWDDGDASASRTITIDAAGTFTGRFVPR